MLGAPFSRHAFCHGERAEVEEFRRQKGVIHAHPLRILESAPGRVEPSCPYFGRCGGCQYQHLVYAAQVAAKVEILRETLATVGPSEMGRADTRAFRP